MNLNPCFGDNTLSVNPMAYSEFMKKIFDFWFRDDLDYLSIGFFENILKWFLGGQPNLCHLCNSCYRHVKVDWNGDVLPCGEFMGSDFKFGNIVTQGLDEIAGGDKYQKFSQLVSKHVSECYSCKWSSLCHGGCSRYSINGLLQKKLNTMCESRKAIFEHIASILGR